MSMSHKASIPTDIGLQEKNWYQVQDLQLV